jgi:uncharacterized protein
MTPLFADTSFFVAFLSPGDEHHETAVEYMEDYPDPLLTTQWVLAELGNFLSARPARKAFQPFVEALWEDGLVRVEEATDEWFRLGVELYGQRPDKEWSLVDCTSFMIMRRRSIQDALTADHHFEQAGYKILMK